MPSSRPAKPSRSVVVALIDTHDVSQPMSAATLSRIAWMNGASFGACAITVASRFATA
jgi:hypothetical protein